MYSIISALILKSPSLISIKPIAWMASFLLVILNVPLLITIIPKFESVSLDAFRLSPAELILAFSINNASFPTIPSFFAVILIAVFSIFNEFFEVIASL